jgi:hypothetical protein
MTLSTGRNRGMLFRGKKSGTLSREGRLGRFSLDHHQGHAEERGQMFVIKDGSSTLTIENNERAKAEWKFVAPSILSGRTVVY